MKYIRKKGCPHGYASWCRDVRGTNMEDYRQLGEAVKKPLLEALIKEQGSICAYTMKRIDKETAHIEHIKPESLCRVEAKGSDLAYDNLVACFPRAGMKAKYRYGAQQKDNWWADDGRLFVSPLHNFCEKRFCFKLNGGIVPANAAAKKTITVLKLDHATLCEERSLVLNEFIYGPSGQDALSAASAKRAIDQVCRPGPGGNFREFCVAIRDGLIEYSKFLEKLAKKKKAIGRSR